MKKVALITGSSRGIGRAAAYQLAHDGYAVCVNYYERQDKADELTALLRSEGCEAIAVQADVSVRAQVNDMVARCERELGPVTLLVNNAGVAGTNRFAAVFGFDLRNQQEAVHQFLILILQRKVFLILLHRQNQALDGDR